MKPRGKRKKQKWLKEGWIFEGAYMFSEGCILLDPSPENKKNMKKVRITIEEL